ncbi:FMN-binding negative transcriptional regulator [Luedemannella helvata]|uniref:FMN-binding negative transcriptional regulator n=1 Tax=Luedemannella helvata TaxID=349315 RepID=A0ABP4X1I1_9ACTN
MFVPDHYRVDDGERVRRVVRENPLCQLVSNGPWRPLITHLLCIDPEPGPELVGTTLLAHLNRANPHWGALADGDPATLVFCGPHGYVSPTVYDITPAAPTWDFITVHVHGTVHPIEAGDPTLEVILETVRICEERFGTGWDPGPSMEYLRRILPGVGAFGFRVQSVDGHFKLSQELTQDVRDRLVDSFRRSPSTLLHGLVDHMGAAGLVRGADQAASVSAGER